MNKKIKTVLIISIVLNLIFISSGSIVIIKKGGIDFIKKQFSSNAVEPYYSGRNDVFTSLSQNKNKIIFVGDSITEGGEWSELFNNSDVVNRGISSDTTKGVLNRIGAISKSNPSKLFIMIGINDLIRGINSDVIISNYGKILDVVKENSNQTKIYIESILPCDSSLYPKGPNADTIKNINKELKLLAKTKDAVFIDVYAKMSENGKLKKDYTFDGLHLNGLGYKTWVEELEKYVTK